MAYGSRQDVNRFLPIIIKGCIENKKFPCSKGNQFRDFVHVDDVVDAIIKSLTNRNARGQIINIGSGKPRKIRNIIEYIKKISNGVYTSLSSKPFQWFYITNDKGTIVTEVSLNESVVYTKILCCQ